MLFKYAKYDNYLHIKHLEVQQMTLVAKSFFLLTDSFGRHIGIPKWNTNMVDLYKALKFSAFCFPNNFAAMNTAKLKFGEHKPHYLLHNV